MKTLLFCSSKESLPSPQAFAGLLGFADIARAELVFLEGDPLLSLHRDEGVRLIQRSLLSLKEERLDLAFVFIGQVSEDMDIDHDDDDVAEFVLSVLRLAGVPTLVVVTA